MKPDNPVPDEIPCPPVPLDLLTFLEKAIPARFVPSLDMDDRKMQRRWGRWELIHQLRATFEHQQNPDVPDSEAT